MTSLKKFQDSVAKNVFGSTKEEVAKEGLCINCKEPALPKCYRDAGRREYEISGLCEQCFDEITGE